MAEIMPAWAQKLTAALLSVTDAVSHTERLRGDRYIVWQEDGVNDHIADGRHVERAMSVSIDLFSVREFDPWLDEIEAALDDAGISFELVSIDYEEETGFYHWSWDFEVGA